MRFLFDLRSETESSKTELSNFISLVQTASCEFMVSPAHASAFQVLCITVVGTLCLDTLKSGSINENLISLSSFSHARRSAKCFLGSAISLNCAKDEAQIKVNIKVRSLFIVYNLMLKIRN